MLNEKQEKALNCIDLVNDIVNEYNINSSIITKEDLFQQGFIGLINAINTFDKNSSYQFRDYATIYIRYAISEVFIKKFKVNKKKQNINFDNMIRVKSLEPYLKRMDFKTANVLSMYFGLDNRKLDINDIAFLNYISTSEIYDIVQKGLDELKDLIEKEQRTTKTNIHRDDSTVYTYYDDYKKEDIDLATLLLTDRQKELQTLRFNKETATDRIRSEYLSAVKPRMIFYLEKFTSLGPLRDPYIEMRLEKRTKIRRKKR